MSHWPTDFASSRRENVTGNYIHRFSEDTSLWELAGMVIAWHACSQV